MESIRKCKAKKIRDSRGEETIEVKISTGDFSAEASVPAGKSTGSREAVALSANEAVRNINEIIASEIIGKKVSVAEIDKFLLELDGTENKSKLGANAILGVSIAVLRLSAQIAGNHLWQYIQTSGGPTSRNREVGPPKIPQQVFPRLFVNVLNGGAHAGFSPSSSAGKLPFQEYMFVLGNGQNVEGPFNQLQVLFEQLKKKLEESKKEIQIGDEGGFSFKSDDVEEPFEMLTSLHDKLAIDVAGGEFFENDQYNVLGKKYPSDELLGIYEKLVEKFPLVSIEDPFSDNDFDGFEKMTEKLGEKIMVVGDDLTTTNVKMIGKAVEEKMINAVLIKPNQIGTVTETLEAINLTHEAGLRTIVSHRSGETMDSFIADLAVGVGAYGIKAGAPSQLERVAKYGRLLEIEKEMSKC
ncbi:MAG: phosphopyruvate hydratase [Patescibacteria group bacterium]|nr:phosphopyruvate hydratase [Patescibacteria group bacterium]